MRWERCGVCKSWKLVRPIYERTYKDHAKDGRFSRFLWICDPCLEALKDGSLVRKDEDEPRPY